MHCTPHISGLGLGFFYMMHFASCMENIGPYQEFKGNKDKVLVISDVSLSPESSKIAIPKGPGLGIEFEDGFLEGGRPVC
ncbi:MAG: enolase C-terminal domain-like protein [Bacteroidota bacterium]